MGNIREKNEDRIRRNKTFQSAIEKHFAFLTSEYGYLNPVISSADLYPNISFRNGPILVQFYHTSDGFPIRMEFTHNDRNENTLTLAVKHCHDIEQIDTCVLQLATQTQDSMINLISGNIGHIDAAIKRQKKTSRERTFFASNHIKLRKAESAWREKDFKKVAELLSPLRQELSDQDKGRLDFSKRKIGG